MNHDYAHCLDFTEKCPKECFRAQLQRDLQKRREEFIGMPISYMHFHYAGLCQCDNEEEIEEEEYEPEENPFIPW